MIGANPVGPGAGQFGFAGTFSSAANGGANQLIDVPAAFLQTLVEGSTVWVQSVESSYVWYPLRTDTPDQLTIVKPTVIGAGAGRFFRVPVPSATWLTRATWYIDPANGVANDENSGATALLPLKSIAEWERRLGYGAVIPQITTIYIQSNVPVTDPLTAPFAAGQGGLLIFKGQPTVTYTSVAGFTAKTDINRATQTPQSVTDTALGGTTWASIITARGRIRVTTGASAGAIAWPMKDLGANAARTSPFCVPVAAGLTMAAAAATKTVSVNDQFVIETLPKMIAQVHFTGWQKQGSNNSTVAVFQDLDFESTTGVGSLKFANVWDGQVIFQGCRFSRVYSFLLGSWTLDGCECQNGGSIQWGSSVMFYHGGLFTNPTPDGDVLIRGGSVLFDYDTIAQNGALFRCRENGVVRVGTACSFDSVNCGADLRDGLLETIVGNDGVAVLWGNNAATFGIRCDAGRVEYTTTKPTITGAGGDTRIGMTIKAYGAVPYLDDNAGTASGSSIFANPT